MIMIGLCISPMFVVPLIKLFQSTNLIKYLNTDVPTNITEVLRLYSKHPFNTFIPNAWGYEKSYTADQDSPNYCTPYAKFEENDMSCWIMGNAGHYMFIFSIVILFRA
jgi:hypothetical protein